jgi:hypothetical protein
LRVSWNTLSHKDGVRVRAEILEKQVEVHPGMRASYVNEAWLALGVSVDGHMVRINGGKLIGAAAGERGGGRYGLR